VLAWQVGTAGGGPVSQHSPPVRDDGEGPPSSCVMGLAEMEIGSKEQVDSSGGGGGGDASGPAEAEVADGSSATRHTRTEFARRWEADTVAWLRTCTSLLPPGGRVAILIGDNAGIDALESIRAAADGVGDLPAAAAAQGAEPRGGGAGGGGGGGGGGRCVLRVLASASMGAVVRRPWNSKKRNYRREHTILLAKVPCGGADV
jgi:hypothetical protein